MGDGMLSLLDNIKTAKAEIQRLTAENGRLRDALMKIVGMDDSHSNEYHVAFRALAGEEKDDE